MSTQVFKYIYLVFGLVVVILAFISLLLFSPGLEQGENLLNGIIIFSPIILSGILVVVSSLLLFWVEKEKFQAAFSINKANIWLVALFFLIILVVSLITFFTNYKYFRNIILVTVMSIFIYPILIAILASSQSKLKTILSEISQPQITPKQSGKLAAIVLIFFVIISVFLLANLFFPEILFGDAVGMAGWAVGLFLGVSLMFLAPVLLILSATRLKQDNKTPQDNINP